MLDRVDLGLTGRNSRGEPGVRNRQCRNDNVYRLR